MSLTADHALVDGALAMAYTVVGVAHNSAVRKRLLAAGDV
jgi:hypothetical protein